MAKQPKKPAKGARTAAYRRMVEDRLAEMGYSANRYRWEAQPARLTIIVNDEMRTVALNAGQARARTEYELGRLAGWAEAKGLMAREQPAPKARAVARDVMQLEMIDAINGTGGHVHA